MITDANDFVRDPRSSRDSLRFGLFTAHDFIRDGEDDEYAGILTSLMSELAPDGAVEETFALEIMGATWRLRRCRLVEEAFGRVENLDIDPMIDERTEKQQKSVDRARAQSHLILRRSLDALRKLQKGRDAVPEPEPVKKLWALSWYDTESGTRTHTFYPDGTTVIHDPPPAETQADTTPPPASSFCNPAVGQVPDLRSTEPAAPKTNTSFCNTAPAAPPTKSHPVNFPRNAQCLCRSGLKYKRCCGKNAPPVLNRAA
jgi:hypothetical protein